MSTCCSNPRLDFPTRQAVQAYRHSRNTPLDQLSWINLELLRRGELLSRTLPRMCRQIRRLRSHSLSSSPVGRAHLSDSRCEPVNSHPGHLAGALLWRGVQNSQFPTPTQARRAATWRNTLGYAQPISDDALAYATARMHLEPLRAVLAPPTSCSSATRRSHAIRLVVCWPSTLMPWHLRTARRCCGGQPPGGRIKG